MPITKYLSIQEHAQIVVDVQIGYPVPLIGKALAYLDALGRCRFLGLESRERDAVLAASDKFWGAMLEFGPLQ